MARVVSVSFGVCVSFTCISHTGPVYFSIFISFLLSRAKSCNIYFVYLVFESLFCLLLVVRSPSQLNPKFET